MVKSRSLESNQTKIKNEIYNQVDSTWSLFINDLDLEGQIIDLSLSFIHGFDWYLEKPTLKVTKPICHKLLNLKDHNGNNLSVLDSFFCDILDMLCWLSWLNHLIFTIQLATKDFKLPCNDTHLLFIWIFIFTIESIYRERRLSFDM